MKNIRFFLSENFQFLEVKFSIYLNRCVFVMATIVRTWVCVGLVRSTLLGGLFRIMMFFTQIFKVLLILSTFLTALISQCAKLTKSSSISYIIL